MHRIVAVGAMGRLLVGGLALLTFLAPRALAADAAPPPAAPAPAASAWDDPEVIARRLAEACDAVEKVCEAKFRRRPTCVVSSRAAVRVLLEAELAPVHRRIGTVADLEASLGLLDGALLAKYEAGAHRIHLVDGQAAHLARGLGRPPPGEDDLRVVLAHEVTHALDFERFGLAAYEDTISTMDALSAYGAVVEGHAQWVAERVAADWGIPEAFARFTSSITEIPDLGDARARQVAETLVAELAFGYVQGHAFMNAVFAARGREGVEAALRTPPTSGRWIEHPDEWLAGARTSGEPDLDAALERVRPLVGDAAWRTQADRVTEVVLRAQESQVAPAERPDFLKGYRDGRMLVAAVAEEDRQVVTLLLWWASEEDALRYARQERSTVADVTHVGPFKVTGSIVDRAGREGRFPGYRIDRKMEGLGQVVPVQGELAVLGRLVAEVIVVNSPEVDAAARADLLERLEAFLRDPRSPQAAPAGTAVALRTKTREVEVSVVTMDGQAVPRALVRIGGAREQVAGQVRDGRATLRVEAAGRVTVWAAAAEDGTRLPWGPVVDQALDAAATEIEVRLPPGLVISGRVLDADGKPVAGVEVQAEEGERTESGDLNATEWGEAVDGRGATAKDGTFTLVGLREATYRMRVVERDRVVVERIVFARGGDDDVTLRRAVPPTLEVVVLDPDGAPVIGAMVVAFAARDGRSGVLGVRPTLAGGRADLGAVEPGAALTVDVAPPERREDLAAAQGVSVVAGRAEVRLAKGRVVRGVVVRPDGTPVAAVIRRRRAEPGRLSPATRTTSSRTEADGSFTLRGLPMEPVELSAGTEEASPFDDVDAPWTTVPPDVARTRLVLAEEAWIDIAVVGPDGEPVGEAVVEVSYEGGSRTWTVRGGSTRTAARSAPVRIAVWGARTAKGEPLAPGEVADAKPGTRRVEVRLASAVRVTGRVVDAQGRGVAGAHVAARRPGPVRGPFGGEPLRGAIGPTATDGDGRFTLEGLGRDEYLLDVLPPPKFVPRSGVAVRGGDADVEIRLEPGVLLRVTVVDADGRPLPGATLVVLRTTRTAPGSTTTVNGPTLSADAQGVVTIPPLVPADGYGLRVEPPTSREDLVALSRERWVPDHETVTLGPARVVRGRVIDTDGRPVEGAEIHRGRGDDAVWRGGPLATSGPDGTFRAKGLPLERLSLFALVPARHPRPGARSKDVEVDVGAEEDEVVLTVAGRPVTVRLKLDAPAGREVRIGVARDGEVRQLVHQVGPDGVLVVTDVEAGDLSVFAPVTREDERCGYVPHLPRTGEQVEVPLAPPRDIRVRLVLPPDATLESLHAVGPFGVRWPARPVEGDLYAVRGLPAGRYEVNARARSQGAEIRASAEVEAGEGVVVKPR
jgi:protocatechuate 3,4-dioxygenase beta subunit